MPKLMPVHTSSGLGAARISGGAVAGAGRWPSSPAALEALTAAREWRERRNGSASSATNRREPNDGGKNHQQSWSHHHPACRSRASIPVVLARSMSRASSWRAIAPANRRTPVAAPVSRAQLQLQPLGIARAASQRRGMPEGAAVGTHPWQWPRSSRRSGPGPRRCSGRPVVVCASKMLEF